MAISQRDMRDGVLIVGGGTAGYLAALTLKVFHPDLGITLIDSPTIPILGVGEGTTSEIVPFLHSILGFDPSEFYDKVRPTWKLGIKFFWGDPNVDSFNYPFDRGPLLESLLYEGRTENATLISALMAADLSPILMDNDMPVSLLSKLPFAYHLDNARFVEYLREKATDRGIACLNYEIVDVILRQDGEQISHLIANGGFVLRYDFYVDCSGFRSLLLEQELHSPFVSYQSSLFTDSAVVANAPQSDVIRPYTTAETMDNGWCWNIPQIGEDHLGYVYSSSFCSPDQAIDELRQKEPEIRDLRLLRFRSGRHRDFVRGNVAAIGNSYGFVEPLESTGIFVICRQCLLLAQNITSNGLGSSTQIYLNTLMAGLWDYIRWFLASHFRFNKRRDTSFWRHCNSFADISGAAHIIQLFEDEAPLSRGSEFAGRGQGHNIDFVGPWRGHNYDYPISGTGHNINLFTPQQGHNHGHIGPGDGYNFDAFGYDIMLLGQGLSSKHSLVRMKREEYFLHASAIKGIVSKAIDQRAAQRLCLDGRPGMFSEFFQEKSWIPMLAESMLSSGQQLLSSKHSLPLAHIRPLPGSSFSHTDRNGQTPSAAPAFS